jgi:cell shape-determining protein MreC
MLEIMGNLSLPTKEQIKRYVAGNTQFSENYVSDLITVCHAVLVEIQEEQKLRDANPELKQLYDEYRKALLEITSAVSKPSI